MQEKDRYLRVGCPLLLSFCWFGLGWISINWEGRHKIALVDWINIVSIVSIWHTWRYASNINWMSKIACMINGRLKENINQQRNITFFLMCSQAISESIFGNHRRMQSPPNRNRSFTIQLTNRTIFFKLFHIYRFYRASPCFLLNGCIVQLTNWLVTIS